METEIICKPAGCQFCAEYSKKRGCQSKHCAYFAERIAAGTLNHKEAILEAFRTIPAFRQNLSIIKRRLSESIWNGAEHRYRMKALHTYVGRSKKFFTNEYLAVMYLLTVTQTLYEHTHQCFTRHGLEFSAARKTGLSIDEYTLLGTAKTIYFGTEDLSAEDIAEDEIVSGEALQYIVNSVLIVRFGEAVLKNFM